MDDWAAALAEQNEQPVPAGATGAGVFQPLSKAAANTTHNDIEMILDIPVKMTVEPAARRSRSATCCSSRRVRSSSWTAWPASRWTCS